MTKSTVPSGNPLGLRDGFHWPQRHTSSQRNKIAEPWRQKQFPAMRSPKASLGCVLFKVSPYESAATCQWSSRWILQCHTWRLRSRYFWRRRKYYISQESARPGKIRIYLMLPSAPRELGQDQDTAVHATWVCIPGKGPGSTAHWESVGKQFYQWRMPRLLDIKWTRCGYQLFRRIVYLRSL